MVYSFQVLPFKIFINVFLFTDSKPSVAEVPLPLTSSMSSHGATPKLREHTDASPHAHSHAHGHAHGHAPAQHAQYPLGLASPPFLSNPSLFNIKSEPSAANGYDGYSHASQHYHSQQHYLHALQVMHFPILK